MIIRELMTLPPSDLMGGAKFIFSSPTYVGKTTECMILMSMLKPSTVIVKFPPLPLPPPGVQTLGRSLHGLTVKIDQIFKKLFYISTVVGDNLNTRLRCCCTKTVKSITPGLGVQAFWRG